MADAYVCPVEGKSYPDVFRFIDHAVVAHAHRRNDPRCPCACCHPEWIQPALDPKG